MAASLVGQEAATLGGPSRNTREGFWNAGAEPLTGAQKAYFLSALDGKIDDASRNA